MTLVFLKSPSHYFLAWLWIHVCLIVSLPVLPFLSSASLAEWCILRASHQEVDVHLSHYDGTDSDCLIKVSYNCFKNFTWSVGSFLCWTVSFMRAEAISVFSISVSTRHSRFKLVRCPCTVQGSMPSPPFSLTAVLGRTNWDLRWGERGSESGRLHNRVISSNFYLSYSGPSNTIPSWWHLGKALLLSPPCPPRKGFNGNREIPQKKEITLTVQSLGAGGRNGRPYLHFFY